MLWRAVGEGLVVYHAERERFVEFNASGRLLWETLAARACRRPELVDLLVDTYGIEPDQAARDVESFTTDLRAADLLIGVEG